MSCDGCAGAPAGPDIRIPITLVADLCVYASCTHPATLDTAGAALLDPLRDEAIQPAATIARLALQSSDVVADIGAGPGYLSLPLARAVPAGQVIATDIRSDYLAVLRDRAAAAQLGNITTRVVRAAEPGLPSRSLDLAVLCQVDHYLPDRARFFVLLGDALRPGGRIAIVNHARHREAIEAAATSAGLSVTDQWAPSPGFFAAIYQPSR